jgi:uridine kinase
MSVLIDQAILIDIPLEICLARMIKRNIRLNRENSLTLIPKYLNNYEDYFRDIYREAVQQARKNCDLIINDVNAVEVMSKCISKWLQSRS